MPKQPSADQLLSLLQAFGNCPSNNCGEENRCFDNRHYCQAYVGPKFGHRERVLFVGLDQGKPDPRNPACLDTERRQKQILEYRDQENFTDADRKWNDHYKGCVIQAGRLLKLACDTECEVRCAAKDSPECALLHFVQTNVIKSVPRDNTSMRFVQHHMIERSMHQLIDEIKIIQPSIMILHGKPLHGLGSGATLENDVVNLFVNKLQETGHTCTRIGSHVWKVNWMMSEPTQTFESYVACFFHPSMGHHRRQWKPVIVPAIDQILRLMQH